jgi:hypothetical protein
MCGILFCETKTHGYTGPVVNRGPYEFPALKRIVLGRGFPER